MERYNPHKTAIWRKEGTMTTPSRWLLQRVLTPRSLKPKSVLDFGAGTPSPPVNYLLIGKYGHVYRVPIDPASTAINKIVFEKP